MKPRSGGLLWPVVIARHPRWPNLHVLVLPLVQPWQVVAYEKLLRRRDCGGLHLANAISKDGGLELGESAGLNKEVLHDHVFPQMEWDEMMPTEQVQSPTLSQLLLQMPQVTL